MKIWLLGVTFFGGLKFWLFFYICDEYNTPLQTSCFAVSNHSKQTTCAIHQLQVTAETTQLWLTPSLC